MNLKELFNEEAEAKVKDIIIYKNPDRSEFKAIVKDNEVLGSASKSVRFLVDEKKKLFFVWAAFVLHRRAANILGYIYNYGLIFGDNKFCWGVGIVDDNKIVPIKLETGKTLIKNMKSKHHWTNKYLKDVDKYEV